jgi:hypothetical protein
MPCDFFAPADPDVLLSHDMVQESLQARSTAWVAGNAQVHSNGHHLRLGGAFAQQQIEGVLGVAEEIIARRKYRPGILGVVDAHRVRHDEMRTAIDQGPIGQLIVVAVGIVEKATFLDYDLPCVNARAIAAIPAERPIADSPLQ